MGEPRRYQGLVLEDRRRQRRAALIETGLDCLDADGLSGVSVRSICSRARLTPRYFYESFADLDGLLLAVVDSVCGEIATVSVAAVTRAPADTVAQVRAAVAAGYGVVAGDRRKANAILVAASGHGPLRDRRQQVVLQYAALIQSSFPVLAELTAADRVRSKATALFLMGGAAELIEAVLSGALRMSRTRLVDQLTAMWVAVLTAPR